MKTARRLSVCILFVTGVLALYGGVHLVSDPTGRSLHLPFFLLRNTIFPDYLLAGWVLLLTVGLSSFLIIACILIKTTYYSFMMMVQGVIISIYVFIMMLLLGEVFLLEYISLLFGAVLIILGAWQYQRKIVSENKREINKK